MSKAENIDRLATEQYGIRKAKVADIQALHTRLIYDLIRQTVISDTSIFENFVSNYDLVFHSIASLSLQIVNVSKEPILCAFSTIQNMNFSVRTAFGYSKTAYGGDTWSVPLNPPPQGLVQGDVTAPAIWDIVSTPLLKCLRKAGHGAAFKFFISGNATTLVEYYFVDDSKIIQVAPLPNTPTEDTVKLAQEGLNIFAGEVRETEGQVSVQKNKWYLLEFSWDPSVKWHLSNSKALIPLKI